MKKRLTFKQLLFEQQILGILLFTLLVVFLWVVSSIYFSYSSSTLTAADEADVLPLDPNIDVKPLETLNARKWWTPEELKNFPVSILIKDESGKMVGSTIQTNGSTPKPASTSAKVATSSAQTP
jgi:hypothetical protein